MSTTCLRGIVLVAACLICAHAADWPEWRGQGRRGVWTETGIVDKFPEKGLRVEWRTPIKGGFSGPAVAAGRVFVTDFASSDGRKGIERALGYALDWEELIQAGRAREV